MKVTIVNSNGHITNEAEANYQLMTPKSGYAEFDPVVWRQTLIKLLQQLTPLPTNLAAISFAGQMHGLVITDGDLNPVTNAILWPDQRAIEVLHLWRQSNHQDKVSLGECCLIALNIKLIACLVS